MIMHGIDGSIAAIGRRSRKIPPALRRAVRERDGYRCTFPGCSTRRTEAHHILYWSLGGPTELGNLLLLCSTHHHLVHAKGYIITRTGNTWTFTNPGTGRTITPASPLPGSAAPVTSLHDADITPAPSSWPPATAWICTSLSGPPCTTAASPRTATTTTITTRTARPHNTSRRAGRDRKTGRRAAETGAPESIAARMRRTWFSPLPRGQQPAGTDQAPTLQPEPAPTSQTPSSVDSYPPATGEIGAHLGW